MLTLLLFQNGVIRGTLLAFRFMGKDRGGSGGVVINTGSNVCMQPYVSVPIYTATKHAIIGFTRAYGVSYEQQKIFIIEIQSLMEFCSPGSIPRC